MQWRKWRAEQYWGWPTYFLIDRSGKVVQAFANEPPTDEAIAELLAHSPAD
jgi:glutathione peroxidase-family protein